MAENYLKEVRNQYEEFPYPSVNPEDEKTEFKLPYTEELAHLSSYCHGGMKDFRNNCRFLVAGGGTGDAVIGLAEQLRDYKAEIVYVDLSGASQRIARERARIRGLEDRVEWHQGSLLSVGEMGIGQFDYVNASGVLHHLASPEEGLKALVSVMKPDGVLGCMLYAKYGRMVVYQLQELLRLINQRTHVAQDRVNNTKTVLNTLAKSNWLFASPPAILQEIQSGDAGIYDLLLHSQDRAYSIPELYEYVHGGGMEIMRFYADDKRLGKQQYDPALYIKNEALLQKIRKLPTAKQEQLAELLNSKIIKHTFLAARKPQPLPSIENPEMIPYMHSFRPRVYEDMRQLHAQSGSIITFEYREDNIKAYFPKTPHLGLFLQYFDGNRTMGELLHLVQGSLTGNRKPDAQSLLLEFGLFYKALNEYDWMLLRHKSIPPYECKMEMQERVTKMYA